MARRINIIKTDMLQKDSFTNANCKYVALVGVTFKPRSRSKLIVEEGYHRNKNIQHELVISFPNCRILLRCDYNNFSQGQECT